ncbi:MAG TPA: hypothetical protein VF506_14950 [Streptosporangiaceae bacterium]
MTTRRMLLRQMTGADLGWLARLHGERRVMRYIDDGKPVPRAHRPPARLAQPAPAIQRRASSGHGRG